MSDVLSSNVIDVIVGELPGPPGVYPPWIEFGIRDLNTSLLIERIDEFLVRAISRL